MKKISALLLSPLALTLIGVIFLSLPWFSLGGYWAMVGFVPLLALHDRMQDQHKRGFLWWVCLTIVLWFALTCFWVSYATWLAIPAIPLSAVVSLLPAFIVYHWSARRNKRALSYTILVCSWILCEWWFEQGDISFSWLTLGGAFAWDVYAIQWYSIFGVYGGSAWVLIANILIYTSLRKPRSSAPYWTLGWVLVPIGASLALYNTYQQSSNTIGVAIIQPNVDAYQKFTSVTVDQQTANIIDLAKQAPTTTTLYIAPETALIVPIHEELLSFSRQIAEIQQFLRNHSPQATFIIGASTFDDKQHYNTALHIDTAQIQTYHKSKLVLGVETIPDWLNVAIEAIDLGGYVGSLGRQQQRTVFQANGVSSGAAVCYESIHPDFFADWARGGAQVMAIITNDGWWGNTPGYRQHFAYCRLRAIESRRTIVRAANTGISGVVDPCGDVVDQLGWDKRGVIVADVTLNNQTTPYMRWGDLIVRLAGYIAALSILFAVATHFRRKI